MKIIYDNYVYQNMFTKKKRINVLSIYLLSNSTVYLIISNGVGYKYSYERIEHTFRIWNNSSTNKKDLLLWNQNCIGWECFWKNAANYICLSKYCTACHAVCVKGLRHMKFAINSCCLDILPMKVSHLLKHHADMSFEWNNCTKYPITIYIFVYIYI